MSIKAMVVFRDGQTRTVEVETPAPRDMIVARPEIRSGCMIEKEWVFRALGADICPIYEQP